MLYISTNLEEKQMYMYVCTPGFYLQRRLVSHSYMHVKGSNESEVGRLMLFTKKSHVHLRDYDCQY
jgi:hypothetical protein